MKTQHLVFFCILVFIQFACGQNQPKLVEANVPPKAEEPKTYYPNLKKQAEDVGNATIKGDFEKIIEYTYPRIIEMMGGREKMLMVIKRDTQQMSADGFDFISVEIGEVLQTEQVENQLFAVLPMKLTVKVPNGKAVSENSLVGISEDKGENWKFISGVSQERFKTVFPKAAEKVKIPDGKPPVMLEN